MKLVRYRAELTPRALAVLGARMTLTEEAAAARQAEDAGMALEAWLATRVVMGDRLERGIVLVAVEEVDLDAEIAMAEAAAEAAS